MVCFELPRKSSTKPPFLMSPPFFKGRKLISPPSHYLKLAPPFRLYYYLLISDRLYPESDTTVKLDPGWFIQQLELQIRF